MRATSTRAASGVTGAPNWLMGMYSHSLGKESQLGLRAMLSFDPLTVGRRGYPELFQTGETWGHQPLHDHQHPHDLFSELSATYSHKLGVRRSAYLYLGYPGEPALGPPTFMHRLIAFDLPDAPLGHHWQDATHITFGVATAGINLGGKLKVVCVTIPDAIICDPPSWALKSNVSETPLGLAYFIFRFLRPLPNGFMFVKV